MSLGIIIKHRRYSSASKRAVYLESEKKKVKNAGRVNYIASGDGVRVQNIWGRLPDGKEVRTGVDIGSALLLGSNCDGRNEIVEFLVSAEAGSPEDEAVEYVERVVNELMAIHFPDVYFIAARHGDGGCVHAHICCLNSDKNGKALNIGKKQFLQIRRDISTWSKLDIKSAWPGRNKPRIGRPAERRFAKLSKGEMEAEILAETLAVHQRNKRTGEIRTLLWKKGEISEIIRFWTAARVESGLSYGLTEIEMAISKWNKIQDKEKLAKKWFNDARQRQKDLLPAAVNNRWREREAMRLQREDLLKAPPMK